VRQTGPRQFAISYAWQVQGRAPLEDYRVFVHFTDSAGKIAFQNDYPPTPRLSDWREGSVRQGPFEVTVPENANGTFNVRIGLFDPNSGQRAALQGRDTGERSYGAGRLRIDGDKIEYQPPREGLPATGDPALFTRADNGWAAGMHSMDRFVKNTYEVLSPLNELTSRLPMSCHKFLSDDRKVQQSIFGEGRASYSVVVNTGQTDYIWMSPLGGEAVLPPNGFVIEGPRFVAFHARTWNNLRYSQPPVFTLRSMDGRPLNRSRQVRVFHALGDSTIRVRKEIRTVQREDLIQH
jgi:hypothetical protein